MDPAPRPNRLLPGVARWPLDPARPIIELRDVWLRVGDHPVFCGLDLRIVPGAITVILGRSGSGKTLLLKLMMGLVRPDRGQVRVFGRDLATASPVELLALRKRMGMLFQNYALFDALTVDANVGFALAQHAALPRREVTALADGLLQVLGLAGSEHLLPAALSGGMKKRVGLARALVADPEVVLLDEPTTGLDPLMVEQVDAMIALARTRYQTTAVVISHDLASTRRLADRVGFLADGKLAFDGTYAELRRCRLPAVTAFLDAARATRPTPSGAAAAPALAPAIITLTDVHKRFGANPVLRGVDLAIHPHRITVLIGASGSGKSVIVKHVIGLLRPDRGQVRVFGEDVAAMDDVALARMRRRLGLVFQHAALLDWMSVEDNIGFPLVERGVLGPRARRAQVDELCERLHLGALRRRLPGALSLGERKRVALARAVAARPDVVIYDEPTTGQDPVLTREIDDLIQQIQQQLGVTTLVISHDMASTFRIAHAIAMIHDGRIVASGTPAELLTSADPRVQHFIHAGAVVDL
ncbi:MAG: ATP-binding cassette domain-containing protein [Myxococcales bacterium]|nr:ATP-binding cassette domain-containing protein [Myxococcales bacterium]